MKVCIIFFIFGIAALIFDLIVLRKTYKIYKEKENKK